MGIHRLRGVIGIKNDAPEMRKRTIPTKPTRASFERSEPSGTPEWRNATMLVKLAATSGICIQNIQRCFGSANTLNINGKSHPSGRDTGTVSPMTGSEMELIAHIACIQQVKPLNSLAQRHIVPYNDNCQTDGTSASYPCTIRPPSKMKTLWAIPPIIAPRSNSTNAISSTGFWSQASESEENTGRKIC